MAISVVAIGGPDKSVRLYDLREPGQVRSLPTGNVPGSVCFHPHGTRLAVVGLKTGVGFKPTYGHVAAGVIRADCPGAASYNLANYAFERIERPMVPLDPDMEWSPGGG